ncbi:carbohydrate kinase family protein [bacterium]|nr:carbohydrate kinase family protein [bacterium]
METAPEVLSAGIIVVDHVSAPIEHLPASGELVLTRSCDLFIGGCAANVAIDLTKLGRRVAILGNLGRDVLGEFAERTLRNLGIETSQLVFWDNSPTSQTLVVNVKGEDRRFIHLRGANDLLSAGQLSETLTPQTRVLYLGGLFLMDRLDPEEVSTLFRQARKQGTTTVLDVVTPDGRDYGKSLQRILPETDFFLPNRDEANLMTGLSDPWDQAQQFRDWGAGSVAITCGSAGSIFLSANDSFRAEAFAVPLVDGTGGGDAFSAGFISGLLDHLDASQCVARGSALGASSVRRAGATEGVFTRDELEEFLAEQTLKVHPR